MPSCPDCGADVRPVEVEGRDRKVTLDAVAVFGGPERFRLLENGKAEAVADGYRQPAYPVHSRVCQARARIRLRA
jgi:hypothetical protein